MKASIFFVVLFFSYHIIYGQLPSYVPSNGIVGWWPFNGNAIDESNNGHNGQVNGAFLTADHNGLPNSAYSFNDNSINIGSISLGSNPSSTFCLWEKAVENTANDWQCLFSLGVDNQSQSVRFMRNGSLFRVAINEYWLQNEIEYQIGFPADFMFYTFTIEPNLLKFFVNGSLVDSLVGNYNTSFSGMLDFGYHSLPSFPYYFHGIIDDVGIWNRILSNEEILALYEGCQLSMTNQPQDLIVPISVAVADFSCMSTSTQATYQWQTDLGLGFQNISNAGQYSGVNTSNLSVSNLTMANNNQYFRCIVGNGNCTDTSEAATLTILDDVGIDGIDISTIHIFPNPNFGILNMEIPDSEVGKKIQLLSLEGTILFELIFTSKMQSIDMSNLSPGIYWIKVENDSPKSVIKI